MGLNPIDERCEYDLFRAELVNLSDHRHGLGKLAELIDWQAFADEWSPQFVSTTGRPALPTRLMDFLRYLKHVYALSDEDTVERWSENPYWQHFSGERYFRHDLPCDASSLVRWRQRIGEAGCEWLLAQSIAAATKGRVIKRASLDEVVLDTTVQPKAIAYPTDSRLLNLASEQLLDAAQEGLVAGMRSMPGTRTTATRRAARSSRSRSLRRHAEDRARGPRLPRRRARGEQTTADELHAQASQQTEEAAQAQASRRADDWLHEGRWLLDRNWLKGTLGDAMHAILCGAAHNLRMILAHLRVLCFALTAQLVLRLPITQPLPRSSRRLALI